LRCLPPAALAAIAVLAAGGCAELVWEKTGVDATTHDRDLEACRQEARDTAWRTVRPAIARAPVVVTDRAGRTFVVQREPVQSERAMVELAETRACMERLGYRLAPASH